MDNTFEQWPAYSDKEAELVSDVLRSNRVNYWTGPHGKAFEQEFAQYTGAQYGVAVANGTLALDLALRTLSIGANDEVIVTPRSFMASVSCIVNAGARPVFADVDLDSQNISAQTIAPLINKKTKAIVCVHLGGWPCDMNAIAELAKSYGLFLIEDCAQAHGARYHGRPVGALGDAGAFSFCQDKIMTTGGEGGMLLLSDAAYHKKAWSYKDHGKSWDAVYNSKHPIGFRWLHGSFGTNWRLTEMQSVLGRHQLQHLDEWVLQRRENAKRIQAACKAWSVFRVPKVPAHIDHAYYRCYVFVEPNALKASCSRDTIMQAFNDLGFPCQVGSCSEIYLEKAFDHTDFRPIQRLANAKQLGQTSLAFPVHPTISEDDMAALEEAITKIAKGAQKETAQFATSSHST